MKFKFKKNSKFKKILCVVLVIGAVVVIGALVSSLARNDDKTVRSSEFSVGALDENGKYVEDKQSIYTKDAFECVGLRIEPDFEADLTYDVYYYDANEKLLEAKVGLTEVYDEDFPLAKLCRVVIHPAIPEGETAKDFKISWNEVKSFAKQVKITVDKNQDNRYSDSVNLYAAENAQLGKTFNAEASTVALTDDASFKVSENITVSGDYEYYDVYVKKTASAASHAAVVIAASEGDTILERELCSLSDVNNGEWRKITIKVPELEGAAYLLIRIPSDAECYVYGYNK